MNDYTKYIRDNIRRLTPYSSARNEFSGEANVFLDANESPYANSYNRYPDPLQRNLKQLISAMKGMPASQIFVGNGSDEAIDLCFRIFCEPRIDNAISIAPSYGMYGVCADINDVEMRQVPLNPDFSLPVEALLAAADEHSKLLFICTPNNPTGNAFPITNILDVVRRFDGMVVVDEAYIDFSSQPSMLSAIAECPNLIVLQTLSKAWGMAALRVGLAFAQEPLMRVFANVKYPYNVNIASQRLAAEMLERDSDAKARQVKEIISQRAIVADRLKKCPCVLKVYPSDANFLLVKVTKARPLYQQLLECGIIVRDRSRVLLCDDCLRITIGTPEENEKMLDIISTFA